MEVSATKLDSSLAHHRWLMSNVLIQFGQNIKTKRKGLGISQDDLAHLADVDRSYVGRIERGEANITIDMLYKLAATLQCSPIELLPDPALITKSVVE